MADKNDKIIDRIRRWFFSFSIQNKGEIATPEGMVFNTFDLDASITEAEKIDKSDRPQSQRGWVREEMVILVAEYFRTRDLSVEEKKKSIIMVSRILRNRAIQNGEQISDTFRNENGIQMQTACIMKYDPQVMRGSEKRGLSGESKLMVEVVKEYLENVEKIKAEAYSVIMMSANEID